MRICKIDLFQPGAGEVSAGKVCTCEIGVEDLRVAKIGFTQPRMAKVGQLDGARHELDPEQIGGVPRRKSQVGARKIRPAQHGILEISIMEKCTSKIDVCHS